MTFALIAQFVFLVKSALKMRCTKFLYQTKVVTNQNPQLFCYALFSDILHHNGVIAVSQICSVCRESIVPPYRTDFFSYICNWLLLDVCVQVVYGDTSARSCPAPSVEQDPCIPTVISFRVLTKQESAFLLYAGPLVSSSQKAWSPPLPLLVLEVVQCEVQMIAEGGTDPLKLQMKTQVNDGNWHIIHAMHDDQVSGITADGVEMIILSKYVGIFGSASLQLSTLTLVILECSHARMMLLQ